MPTIPTAEQRAATRVRPARSPVMYQSWSHLLFLHWQWDASAIQATLPPGLFVDTFANQAYLGVVPFWMDAVRPRFCPPVPGLSWFLELNLRTYVHTADGTPGVWFYSLDCNNPVAVLLGRSLFSLPYVLARQTGIRPSAHNDYCTEFKSQRMPLNAEQLSGKCGSDNTFKYNAIPGSTPAAALPGTLEYFLAERYILFSRSTRTGRLASGQVWHTPYKLAPAYVSCATTLFGDNGFTLPETFAHSMVSAGVDVSIYPLRHLTA
jgi:uncharacterized protein